MKRNKMWGLIVLLLVIATIIIYSMFNAKKGSEISVKGLIGGEKIGLVESEEFKNIMKKKYNIKFDYRKAGSFEMVQSFDDSWDYLFPSSQLALELFHSLGKKDSKNEIVLNTPIVLYSRQLVVDALIKSKVVELVDGVHYVDMVKLANMIKSKTSWGDIGLGELYGNITVATTDPNRSNSGNMFLGLLANSLNGNKPLDEESLPEIKKEVQEIYKALGYMHTSSEDMFNQFLTQGVGAYPIVAGYESQLLEFSKVNKASFDRIKDDIIIMYPKPTVWSSHVYISLNNEKNRVIDALLDPEIQELAYKNHGFRTVLTGVIDENEFEVSGIAREIKNVMSMPKMSIMQELMDAIR
ncbi:MAG: substrate-binding domain-containing protein [Ezakiella sp.]|nr:substrate-binding domain-containing protein [Ezakiella sp.]